MTSQLNDIRRLIPVLDMAFQAEQMKMATVVRRITELREQLAALDRPESFDPMSIATRIGVDVLWEAWVQDRKALITREMAFALRDREAQRVVLITALSKVEAAKQVERRAAMLSQQQLARRSNW